ncbi:MAG: acetylxylan esterase [Alistipes sp.]|nr:acetylxylan esterase [Alistipes sp.]
MRRYLLLLFALMATHVVSAQMAKPQRSYVDYTLLTSEADGTYALGETAEVRLIATAGGNGLDGVQVRFDIGNDGMAADLHGTTFFRRGEARVTIPAMTEPGFRHCSVQFEVAGKTYEKTAVVGFGIDKIEPTIAQPIDFDLFWRKTLKEARACSLPVEVTPIPEQSTEEIEVRMVRIPVFGAESCIYGYLSVPRDGKPHPVLFVPPGAGVKRIHPDKQYAKQGFVTLVIEVHGEPINASDEEIKAAQKRIGNYVLTGTDHASEYYYRRIYAGCVRAIDYLMTLPEWDGKHVGVTGGSQGGALSIVTAALHEDIDFVAAFYPALCDVSGNLHGRAGGWPRLFTAEKPLEHLNAKRVMRTLSYYDVVNFARRVRVPGFYSYGFNDRTCPPTSMAAALNCIKAPKQLITTPASAHWRYPEVNNQATEWMKEQCNQ